MPPTAFLVGVVDCRTVFQAVLNATSTMIPWALLNTFAIPIVLFVLRNGLQYYRSLRSSYAANKPSIRPLPAPLNTALNALFVSALLAFLSTLPYFSPENVFAVTKSRLQTPTNVLFNRLAALRPLSARDELLRASMETKEGRLVYLAYGPDVLAGCTWCQESEPWSWFIHALPALLAPHLAHLAVLGLSTSRFMTGAEGARWRYHAAAAGLVIAALDVYAVYSYDMRLNTRSLSSNDLDAFFWRARTIRGLVMVAVDVALAGTLWAAGTNRLFVQAFSTAERLGVVEQALTRANFMLWAGGNVRNAVARHRRLAEVGEAYWTTEGEIYEEREVVNALRGALSRIDTRELEIKASGMAKQVVEAV